GELVERHERHGCLLVRVVRYFGLSSLAGSRQEGADRPRSDDRSDRVDDALEISTVERGEADPAGADRIDAELVAQSVDLLAAEPREREHPALALHEAEIAGDALVRESLDESVAHGADPLTHAGEFGLPLAA